MLVLTLQFCAHTRLSIACASARRIDQSRSADRLKGNRGSTLSVRVSAIRNIFMLHGDIVILDGEVALLNGDIVIPNGKIVILNGDI